MPREAKPWRVEDEPTPPGHDRVRVRTPIGELVFTTSRAAASLGWGIGALALAFSIQPMRDAMRERDQAERETAGVLRTVSADVIAAREGVEKIGAAQARFDDRLGKIETDVGELRRDLRATCAPGKR